MEAACSRKGNREKPISVTGTVPHQPWPASPNNVQSSFTSPHMQSTPVENLPEDFGHLINLRILFMSHLVKLPPSCEGLRLLVILDLANCKLEGRLPSSIGALTALKTLNLQSNNLFAVETLPGSLQHLDMANCHGLIDFLSLAGMRSLRFLSFCNCRALTHIHGLEFLTALEEINLAGCTSMMQRGLDIMNNKALRMCFLSGSKVAVKYDNTWSEEEPALQLITYYGAAIGYLPSVSRKIKDTEWSYELLMETTISSNKECVAVIISFAGCDQGLSSFSPDRGQNSANIQTTFAREMLPEEINNGETETRSANHVCYVEGRVMRGNTKVLCSRLFYLKHVDELNQVYLCTLRKHHLLVQSLQLGDKICLHARCEKRRWAITVEGALCVMHGENESQVVAVNSKLLNERQSKEFCSNFGDLFLGDNIRSSLADFLQDARSESDEICTEQPIREDSPESKHSRDSNADVNISERRDSCEMLDQQG